MNYVSCMDGQEATARMHACATARVGSLDYAVFTLHGLDGFGYYEVKHGLDMDLATLEWTLLGHLPFGFGLRSSSRLICTL
jgi:hypothetical protein